MNVFVNVHPAVLVCKYALIMETLNPTTYHIMPIVSDRTFSIYNVLYIIKICGALTYSKQRLQTQAKC